MGGKSIEQRVAEADQRIRQLQARKQALGQRLRQQERKARTRRLIQIGAIVSNLGVDTPEKAQALQREVEGRRKVRAWLDEVIARAKAAPATGSSRSDAPGGAPPAPDA